MMTLLTTPFFPFGLTLSSVHRIAIACRDFPRPISSERETKPAAEQMQVTRAPGQTCREYAPWCVSLRDRSLPARMHPSYPGDRTPMMESYMNCTPSRW